MAGWSLFVGRDKTIWCWPPRSKAKTNDPRPEDIFACPTAR
jgi:hypothetical protein